MAAQESGSRPGYNAMRWSWYWFHAFTAIVLGAAAYLVIELFAGWGSDANLAGTLFGTALTCALGVLLVVRSLRTAMTDDAILKQSGVLISTPKWTGEVSPGDVERVRQMHSNPYNVREIPIPSWRYWIRFDFASGTRGFRTLYIWHEAPVEFLEALRQRGFSVQGEISQP